MKQSLERKHSARITALALLLTMLAWLVPVNIGVAKAATDNIVKISVTEGHLLFDKETGTITGHEGEITEAVIPEMFDGAKVTTIGESAFEDCSDLSSVSIPGSVTTIGYEAFGGCGGLSSITVDENNSYYSDEQGVLFNKGKTGLIQYPAGKEETSYDIPGSVTTIGDYAFEDCSGLSSVSIPGSVTTIGEGAFARCSSLSSVTISEGVTEIGYEAFRGCSGLSNVSIPGSVTEIRDYAFKDCSNLSSVSISEGVVTIGSRTFYGCSNLSSVSIPGSVTTIEGFAFEGCSGLSSVSIPRSVTEIEDGTFRGCSGLSSVSIPSSVTAIMYCAFEGCSGLSSVTISEGVTTIGSYAFHNCSNLRSVSIPGSMTTIEDSAFEGCSGLSSVTIPDSVTSIGEKAFGYAWDDDNYESIKISGFKIYGHSNDSAAAKYAKANGFDYAIVGGKPGGDTKPAGDNGNHQTNAPTKGEPVTDSTTAKVGSTVQDKKSNGAYVVTRSQKNGGTVTYKKPVNKKKSSVTIPATVKIEGKTYKVTTVEKNAFKGNKNLKSVKIGSNIETIGANAFNKCAKLKTVKLPSKVKTIQKGAFAGCKNLKTIVIQTKKLTKKTVGAGAFKGVSAKATVKAPKGKAKAYKTLLRSRGLSKKAKVK